MANILNYINKLTKGNYNSEDKDRCIFIELLIACIMFPLCLILTWVVTWVLNFGIIVCGISIQSLVEAIIFPILNFFGGDQIVYYWKLIFSFLYMTSYLMIPMVALSPMALALKNPLFMCIIFIISGAAVICIYDPEIKEYLSYSLYSYIDYMQAQLNFRIVGGPDVEEFTWTSSYPSICYRYFDIYTSVTTLFFIYCAIRDYIYSLKK